MRFSFDIYAIGFGLTEVEGEHRFCSVVTTKIMLSNFSQILPWKTINNRSYGIGSVAGDEAELIILNDKLKVETEFLESRYCTRWLIPDPEATPIVLEYFIDHRICDYYTEEELAACDTVTVEEFGEFMVQSYELNEEIPIEGDWRTRTVLIKNAPKQPGDFRTGNFSQYLVFKKEEEDGSLKYGWLAITINWDYWTTGTIESYGMMN